MQQQDAIAQLTLKEMVRREDTLFNRNEHRVDIDLQTF